MNRNRPLRTKLIGGAGSLNRIEVPGTKRGPPSAYRQQGHIERSRVGPHWLEIPGVADEIYAPAATDLKCQGGRMRPEGHPLATVVNRQTANLKSE